MPHGKKGLPDYFFTDLPLIIINHKITSLRLNQGTRKRNLNRNTGTTLERSIERILSGLHMLRLNGGLSLTDGSFCLSVLKGWHLLLAVCRLPHRGRTDSNFRSFMCFVSMGTLCTFCFTATGVKCRVVALKYLPVLHHCAFSFLFSLAPFDTFLYLGKVVVRPSSRISFPYDTLSKHQWIFTKPGKCTDFVKIWFGN